MKKLYSLFALFLLPAFVFSQSAGNENKPTKPMTDEQYFITYIEKLEKTQSYLTYMNKKGSIQKLGTETINGTISGTLFYTTKFKGMGAEVLLRYKNFSCEEGWTFDGDILVYGNLKQDGPLSGTITVTGVAPAKVYYDGVFMKNGMPATGNYYVEQAGGTKGPVPYSVYVATQKKK